MTLQTPSWLPRQSTTGVGELVDMSVDTATEAELRRSRWVAAVRVELPRWARAFDEVSVAAVIDGCLRGRRPITGLDDGAILTTFTVADGGLLTEVAITQFAASIARDGERTATSLFHVDGVDLDHLLPSHRQSIDRP